MAKKRDDKNWSMDDVDRLLSRTEKAPQKEETVVENFARTMRLADTMVTTSVSAEEAARVESLEEDTTVLPSDYARIAKEKADVAMGIVSADTGDIQISSKTAKQRVSDVLKGLKKAGKKSPYDTGTVRIDFDEPLIPSKEHSMEVDENRRKFLERVKFDDEDTGEQTKIVERPGFVMQKGDDDIDLDLESVPTLIEAEDFINTIIPDDAEVDESQDLWDDGQIKLVGFEIGTQEPEKVNELEEEKNLKVKRREKIDKFKLMGIAEAEEEGRATNGKLEKLFGEGSNDDKTDSVTVKTNPAGVEYTNVKDANRVRATLHKVKRLSAIRFAAFSLITVAMFVINIVSKVTLGFDATLSHSINTVLLIACIIIGMNTINSGVAALLKRQPNLKTSVTVISAMAVVQSVVSFALEEFMAVEGFVISACAAFAFAVDEFGDYLRHSRTYDAFNFCTGREKENLHSVQRVENKNDEFEIGRVLLMNKPDVRYSCKTNFPTKLIERCESEVSSDKLTSLLLPLSFAAGLICAVLGGVFSKSFVGAVTYLSAAVCVCVPAFGVAAIQLPLRWVNKRLNKAGGMISGQKAVDDFSKTNAVVVDSADIFDQQACRLHGIRDFKKVRIDDLTLYAAAMMVKSGGPLTAVFDQVVSKRDLLPAVHSFNYEERMGVSGWINGQKVIMGNRNMMKHHNMELPDISEEERYTTDGRKVIYLAIANQLAAMMVVSYAPNKKLIPFIRRLGTNGVTVLLRNYDSNITTDMINEVFGVRFNNIRLISNTSGRIYKKYKNRVRETSKTGILHDGNAFSLFRSFTMSYSLCGTFKVENLIQLINVIVGFAVIAVFSIFDVISIMGVWPLLLVQAVMTAVSFLVARVRGIF
ncbi:MAG: hypothetical protein IJZ88_00075 [Clostridia bacterium]|nr:hypothetical protein [Clostridia bacterium]